MAIERNPVSEWQAKALAEKQPDAAFTALLALARLGSDDTQPAIFKALNAFPFADLTEAQVLDKLRVIEVSIARQGVPTGDIASQVIADVDPLYPAKTEFANRELCQVLLALGAPDAVAKTVALLRAAPTQEEQMTYVIALRTIKDGWTEELRREYLSWWNEGRSTGHPAHVVQWFKDAGISFNNGASFGGFLRNALNDAKASMTPAELAAMGDLTKLKPAPKAPAELRKFVKDWKTADLQPLFDKVTMNDGAIVAGRINQETDDKVVVLTNPFDDSTTATISKSGIKSRELSKVSAMPPGLLNTFSEDEILDLLAFLESMGDPTHPDFSK